MLSIGCGGGESFLMINVISVKEAANRLKVGRAAVYSLVNRGVLKAFKLGGRTSSWRISEESLALYMSSSCIVVPSFLRILGRKIVHKRKRKLISLLALRYYEGLSVSDVAAKLGVSTTTFFSWESFVLSCVRSICSEISYYAIKDDLGALRVCARSFMKESNESSR